MKKKMEKKWFWKKRKMDENEKENMLRGRVDKENEKKDGLVIKHLT